MADLYINIPDNGNRQWKAAVDLEANLPTVNNTIGDIRLALDTFFIYIWTGAAWSPVSGGAGTGDVTGPAGAVDGALAMFNGVSGKLITDSTIAYSIGGGNVTLDTTGTNLIFTTDNLTINTTYDHTYFDSASGWITTQTGVNGFDDAIADTNPGLSIVYQGGNKTAGTGNGGDVVLNSGSSVGGDAGNIVFLTGGVSAYQIDGVDQILHNTVVANEVTGANTATFTNAPVAGNPIAYLKIKLSDGTIGVIPVLASI